MKDYHSFYLLFKWIVIPCLLLILGFFLSFSLDSNESISVIVYPKDRRDVIAPIEKPLMKGMAIKGEFVAKADNLGILAIRFNTYKRASNDIVIFRIKERSEKNWYYQANYKVDQFQHNEFFTFGFPTIINSKGKMYDFKIESTSGRKNDAISVSSHEPIFVTKHVNSKGSAILNIVETANYIGREALRPSSNLKFSLHPLLYFTPIIFYVFLVLFNQRLGAKIYYSCLSLLTIYITLSSEFNSLKLHDFHFYIVGILWIMGIFIYRLKSEVTFLLSSILLCLSFGAFIFGNFYMSERVAIFVYWFLVIAMIEFIIEVSMRKSFERGYKKLLKLIFT